jgi:hypothetical protein
VDGQGSRRMLATAEHDQPGLGADDHLALKRQPGSKLRLQIPLPSDFVGETRI